MKPLAKTRELGTEWWNDSCALNELKDAVDAGATGATSNPVIVSGAVKGDPKTWTPVLDQLTRDFPKATEDEIAWELIQEMGRRAAKILEGKGRLSLQVSPKFYRDPERMVEHGKKLAAVASNTAIKLPCTAAGIEAMESLTAEGIPINATVSFTLSQLIAAAEAVERGAKTGKLSGTPVITLMVGRLDDHLQRVMTKESVTVNPGYLSWAGVAVAKRAHQLFLERGYRSTLLIAAYRHQLHWSELIGEKVIMTMPYNWWRQFDASGLKVEKTIDRPVDRTIVDTLYEKFPDFRLAYDDGALKPAQFASYGATVHTLNQFLTGYQELLGVVRERMIAVG